MLGLIYPAVLGNLLYIVLGVLESIYFQKNNPFEGTSFFTLKFYLLIVTVIFYLADYLYSLFTNNFRWWMFLFDLVFVVGLYFTYKRIHIALDNKDNLFPDIDLIILFYMVFILLYLFWDFLEKKSTTNDDEKKFYTKIIIWECSSIVLLSSSYIVFKSASQETGGYFLLIVLSIITFCFMIIDIRKFKFWKEKLL